MKTKKKRHGLARILNSGCYSGAEQYGEELLDMPAVTFVAPILPNKEEAWRRFVQEVTEERIQEYEGLRRRLGIRNESVWLVYTKKGGETAMVYVEAENPERIALALVASEEPFDLWFKERLLEYHGLNLVRVPKRAIGKLIFAYQDVSKVRPLVSAEGSP